MASTGNVFAGTGENNAGIGATAWTSPGNVVSDNTTDATCNAAASSQYLVARNFALGSVPTNATIAGITVRIEASESSSGSETLNARLQDASAALVGSGKTATVNGTSKIVYTYGTASDVWGATLTPAIVHDADFGCRFWFATAHNVAVDFVTLAVEYTVPAPGVAVETDTALALSKLKVCAVGVATETDAALALAARKVCAPGVAAEVDSALARPWASLLARETDAAVALGWYSLRASEVDAALALAPAKLVPVGAAVEVDEAVALELAGDTELPYGVGVEVDEALALAPSKLVPVGVAVEVDSAAARPWASMLAAEVDQAVARPATKLVPAGAAAEVNAALALAPTKRATVGAAQEVDASLALSATKLIAVAASAEVDAALALSARKLVPCGAADEVDEALALTIAGGQPHVLLVRAAVERDSALAPGASMAITAIASAAQGMRAEFSTSSYPSSAGTEAGGVRVAQLVAWGLDGQGDIVGLVVDGLGVKPATDFDLLGYLTGQE